MRSFIRISLAVVVAMRHSSHSGPGFPGPPPAMPPATRVIGWTLDPSSYMTAGWEALHDPASDVVRHVTSRLPDSRLLRLDREAPTTLYTMPTRCGMRSNR